MPQGLEGSGVFLWLPWPWLGAFTCWGFGFGAGTLSLGPAALGGGWGEASCGLSAKGRHERPL